MKPLQVMFVLCKNIYVLIMTTIGL